MQYGQFLGFDVRLGLVRHITLQEMDALFAVSMKGGRGVEATSFVWREFGVWAGA